MEGENLPEIDAPMGIDKYDEVVIEFTEAVLDEIDDLLRHNREVAKPLDDPDVTVDDILSTDNINVIDIRGRALENPRATVWLNECPTWANAAWKPALFPYGLDAFNGNVNVTIDVRPL